MKKHNKADPNTGSSDKQDNSVNERSNTMRKSRRRLIQGLVAGGAVVTAKSVPGNWSRPVVEAVMLPAHARTSVLITLGNNGNFRGANYQGLEQTESLLASGIEQGWDAIYNTLVEEANAQDDGQVVTPCGLAGCSYIEYLSGENSGKLFVYVGDLAADQSLPRKISFDFTNGQTGSFNDPCFQLAIDFRVDLMTDEMAKLTIFIPDTKPLEVDLVKIFECVPQLPVPG